MKNCYRINVRFDLTIEREKEAAEYLAKLTEEGGGTRNRFIVEAVTEAISRRQNGAEVSVESIRAMLREELQSVSFANAPTTTVPSIRTELTEEEKEANEASVLSALAMFG